MKMAPRFYQIASNNQLWIFFSLTALCLFVSTAALSNKQKEIIDSKDINNQVHGTGGSQLINQSVKKEKYDDYRLQKNVLPKNYKLYLWPDVTSKTFNGSVTISLDVLQSISVLTLHAKKLSITSATLENDTTQILITGIEVTTDKKELLNLRLENEITKGLYLLKLKFQGELDGFVGFYASRLKNKGTMVASKFQPTYARQAFPCFDEPDFKATYDITLVKPASYVALSNMNEISKTLDNNTNTEVVTFATSVPMSTYLACFVICDFDFKETEINANGIGNNFMLRSFAQKGQTHKIDFAQDIGKRATEYYIKYYEVPFPLPKLDMIAIPDYVSGATEHWGLITYRETSFLVDEATASAQNKINVANTIAHELAHMWFGNLVTMKWWDEVWLNEGFASYMQVKSLNAIEPSWTMLDKFLVKTLHPVLVTDAKLSSHPIVQTVETPDQITAIFDAISYNKGSSVLRMLEGFIGEENFRRGVSDYLKKYKFGNTITQDLLSSLEPYFLINNPELNLSYIMDTWTRQMGYPVLTVTEVTPNVYQIKQSRFLLDPEAVSPNDSKFNYRWFVPITYKTNEGLNGNMVWFSDKVDSVTIAADGASWLKINNNQVGYYRVNYSTAMWQKLMEQLKSKSDKLTISDRSQLLNDAFALAEARVVTYDLPLNLTSYLKVEGDYVPWQTASSIFRSLSVRLLGLGDDRNEHLSSAYDDLQKYVQRLVEPIYKKYKWTYEKLDVIQGLLRTRIFELAAQTNLPDARDKIRNLFLTWLNSHESGPVVPIETDLRDIVYLYGMRSATESEWNKLWAIYLKESDVQEQSKLRFALAAPRDLNILRKYLELAWDESNIRSQDYLNVLNMISNNPEGTQLIWDHVRNRWPQLIERYTLNSRYLGGLVYGITNTFNTQEKLAEIEAWFKKYPEAGAGASARERALETVRNNVKWTATCAPQVANWLRNQQVDTE